VTSSPCDEYTGFPTSNDDIVINIVTSGTLPSLSTKLRLYRVFILPVILYGAETWSPTRQLARNLDAFYQWCLRRILGISWRNRISNEEVRRRTDQPPLTDIIRTTHLKYFGHIARADPSMDHSRALRASVAPLPRDWKRRAGRPRHTWLRTVESLTLHLSTLV